MGKVFFSLRGEIDTEWTFADGSFIRAHQHASGARRGEKRAIGKSRGGNTTKIHMVSDSYGYPISFEITGGEVHDSALALKLLDAVPKADYFICDKAYDSEKIRNYARSKSIKPIIPRRKNSSKANPDFDSYLYRLRHLVENIFARLKHFRGIATRFEKLARNFKSVVYIACLCMWLRAKLL